MGASLDSRDHRHAYIGYVFQKLNAFVVNLAPNAGIGDVAERRKIDVRNKLAARSRQNYDLVRSILCNPIEGIDKLRMILCCEIQQPGHLRSPESVLSCDMQLSSHLEVLA